MLIDWFTTGAQIINFLILVYLLRRFLYRPLVDAMTARREEIAQEFQNAEHQRSLAEESQRSFQLKSEELERRREAVLEEARSEAEALRESLMQEARHDVDAERVAWRQEMIRQKEAFFRRLEELSRQQVLHMARQALRDMADVEVESAIVRVFLRQLEALDEPALRTLQQSVAQAGYTVSVASGFDLPAPSRQVVANALRQRLDHADLRVTFARGEDVIAGLELQAGGSKLAWSLEGYLRSIEDTLSEAIAAELGQDGAQAHE